MLWASIPFKVFFVHLGSFRNNETKKNWIDDSTAAGKMNVIISKSIKVG
jgi:hypothetical protein